MTFIITPVYDILLRGSPKVPAGLYQLQILTAEQLTRLHYSPGMIKHVKARLKTLTDHGYVQSDVIPSRRWRKPFYYALGLQGMRYLDAAGLELPPSWRAAREINQHWLFVEHTLELNDVLISALLSGKLFSLTHERTLKRAPFKVEGMSLIPDAYLEFRDQGKRFPILLEHDRGTEEQRYFRRRVRAYATLLKTRGYEQTFDTRAMTAAFTTFAGTSRVEQMRSWARAELAREPSQLGDLFRFAALDPPLHPVQTWFGAQWLSPYETEAQPLLAA